MKLSCGGAPQALVSPGSVVQDRYVGDIGDYFKYALLRHLAKGRRLGVMWYLFPDEDHNDDGKHITYLSKRDAWRQLDPELFDTLKHLVDEHRRSTAAVAQSGILGQAKYVFERLDAIWLSSDDRRAWRSAWFEGGLNYLSDCNLVFADPDNGLCEDDIFKPGSVKAWKRLPMNEARKLAAGRTAIIYHHNTRYKGGHEKEVGDWIMRLQSNTVALRWRAYNSRTFFIINPTKQIQRDAQQFVKAWGSKAEFYNQHGLVK